MINTLGIEDLVFEDGVKKYLEERKRIISDKQELFLFGSARGGERVYDLLEQWGLSGRIIKVVDNDVMKQGRIFHGIEIVSALELMEYMKTSKDPLIIIASGAAHIIIEQLIKNGLPQNRLCPFITNSIQTDPTPCEYLINRKEQISKTYNLFLDDKSKNVFISLLNFRMTRDDKWLKEISDDEKKQYFDGCVEYSDDESIVDCGAYIGDTLDEYASYLGGRWKNYYCFEADADVYMDLKRHVAEKRYSNVDIYNIGCWDKKDKLYFEKQGSGSSQIVEDERDTYILADSLDNVLQGKTISIIKMDIEGAEQKALKGAEGLIKQQKPRLAISTYHSLEDFLLIPSMICDYGYNVVLRHYRSLSDSETVCYGVTI